MDSSCDAAAVPFTLIGALLTAGPAAWPACVGGGRAFLRDYAQRGTNALLWAGLLATTWVLLLRLVALLRLWALGSRIPGPHAFLADPGLAAVLRAGGDITVGGGQGSLKITNAVLGRIRSISSDFVESRYFSQHMAFNIIGATLFGDAFFDWSDAAAYEELLMMVAKDGCFWASYAVPPFWKPGYRRYRTLCAKFKIFTQGIIRKSKDQNITLSHVGMIKDPRGGVSNGMMSGDGAAEGPHSSEEETCGSIMGLMLHGISTSANLISNILTRVVLSPKLQDQLYADIVAICNESSELNIDDVLRMQYLLATVCESARLLPAGPLLQRCSLEHDLTLESGITVPAGAVLVVPLHLVQMDNSMWGSDAGQFNPQRFLEKDVDIGEILAAPNGSNGINLSTECAKTESFLPFGSGSRACVGQKFVILAISMLIASLLRNYEVKPHPHVSKEMDQTIRSNNLHHLPNLKITLIKREI
ncbi:hypothetical protein PR202_gb21856 [Eleusine coracana subsp. coracana]|uniref:Uncharacterized protein n=1 Tax=Eleusine coracana subsp. coracana TaxID=191504 RepID=A0AAV5FF42_ELECO|nr:hypothetical protein PR202_gb21856 [Eleusine coracana subsp. coracana]